MKRFLELYAKDKDLDLRIALDLDAMSKEMSRSQIDAVLNGVNKVAHIIALSKPKTQTVLAFDVRGRVISEG